MQAEAELALSHLLLCPECESELEYQPEGLQLICQGCQACYSQVEGVWQLLTEKQIKHYQPFMAAYRPLRQAEGWERAESGYYLNLPSVPATDRQAPVWRIRQRSLGRVETLAGTGDGQWALELGAGNGWLSRRLVKLGYKVVALDLNATGPDSLEGGRLFQEHDNIWFGRVQASMEQLPFRPGSFALCVVSGALHYSDLALTLNAVWRVLKPGGHFIISDSPVYTQAASGQRMAVEYRERVKQNFGYEAQWVGGSGFLVEVDLLGQMRRLGFEVALYSVERRLGRFKRRVQRLLQTGSGKREEARFPVIVGHKPAQVRAAD